MGVVPAAKLAAKNSASCQIGRNGLPNWLQEHL